MSTPKRIVIVGAGVGGGATVAKTLSAKLPSAKITLINPRPYTVFLPTLPRMTVSDSNDLFDTALIPLDKVFANKNGTFVEGVVETINATKKGGEVVLADGQQIGYDVLVLATGSTWEGPLDLPDDKQAMSTFIAESRAQFKKAQKIILVGGGAVGIEIAGEIKDVWPEKKVTIVHGANGVTNATYPKKFRNGLEKSLRARGIDLILNDYVDEIPPPGPATITTRNGSRLEADLVVPTRGPRPRTEFISKSLGATVLNEQGQVKVKPTLQLVDHPDIFAVGDIIDTVEQKQFMKATAHAGIVAPNVIAYLKGASLKPYKGSPEVIIVTNGKGGGMGYMGMMGGITLGGWFAKMAKGKGLFLPMARGAVGYS
ncbi:FAD/NAD(P)-binding domain-containing protein [Mycena alexandri]|uniref:FAD/NAD(P)-binding domain-containing protein n=1 Tax=Mycena alexandri TaxID=1745969 RepID=A0AAD6X6V2_9AGAR|nr:FAD/NAD(P)-binding domain-containing protein [Mycena alexandri]